MSFPLSRLLPFLFTNNKEMSTKTSFFQGPTTKFTIKRCNFKPFFFYFEQFFIYLIFRQVQYNYAVSSISDKERVPIDPNYKLMSGDGELNIVNMRQTLL